MNSIAYTKVRKWTGSN